MHVCFGKLHLTTKSLQVQAGQTDISRFQRVVKMIAFHPFESAENVLENINAITDHELTDDLRVFTNNALSFVEIEVIILN